MTRVFREQRDERTNRAGREPTESGRVTESIECSLWVSESDDGAKRIHWGIGRHNPNGKPYRTFHIRHLLEVPEFVSTLASALATSNDLSADLREELANLASAMKQVIRTQRRSSYPEGNGRSDGGLLNA